jgi:hypothetical protein
MVVALSVAVPRVVDLAKAAKVVEMVRVRVAKAKTAVKVAKFTMASLLL